MMILMMISSLSILMSDKRVRPKRLSQEIIHSQEVIPSSKTWMICLDLEEWVALVGEEPFNLFPPWEAWEEVHLNQYPQKQ